MDVSNLSSAASSGFRSAAIAFVAVAALRAVPYVVPYGARVVLAVIGRQERAALFAAAKQGIKAYARNYVEEERDRRERADRRRERRDRARLRRKYGD